MLRKLLFLMNLSVESIIILLGRILLSLSFLLDKACSLMWQKAENFPSLYLLFILENVYLIFTYNYVGLLMDIFASQINHCLENHGK